MNDADEVTSSPQRRRRSCVQRVAFAIAVLLVSTSCAGQSSATGVALVQEEIAAPSESTAQATDVPATAQATDVPATPAATQVPPTEVVPTPSPHPLTETDTELPSAPIGFDQLTVPQGPQPVSIEIENINVREAQVIPVGVNPEDQSFEVPPADQVGWYEFGPSPGEPGSSVLAAHIAYNGVDGVFRYLEDVEVGSVVVIGFDDGSTSRYRIEEVVEYVKEELPDSLFARDGQEQLALITCGGSFNYQLDSYESNTVAIAVPIS